MPTVYLQDGHSLQAFACNLSYRKSHEIPLTIVLEKDNYRGRWTDTGYGISLVPTAPCFFTSLSSTTQVFSLAAHRLGCLGRPFQIFRITSKRPHEGQPEIHHQTLITLRVTLGTHNLTATCSCVPYRIAVKKAAP